MTVLFWIRCDLWVFGWTFCSETEAGPILEVISPPDEIEVTPPTGAAPKKRLKARKLTASAETEAAAAHARAAGAAPTTANRPDERGKGKGEQGDEEGLGEKVGGEGRGGGGGEEAEEEGVQWKEETVENPDEMEGRQRGAETEDEEVVDDDESATLTDTDTEAPTPAPFVSKEGEHERKQRQLPQQRQLQMHQSHDDAAGSEHAGGNDPIPVTASVDNASGAYEMAPATSSARACCHPKPDGGGAGGVGAGGRASGTAPSVPLAPIPHPGEHHLGAEYPPPARAVPPPLEVQINS